MRWKLAAIVVLAFAGAQIMQPISGKEKPGAPLLTGSSAPKVVLNIVDRSCRDCHSWGTKWPWYSKISPLSWIIARDVERGRRFLNLSEWPLYSRAQKLAFVAAMGSAANQDRMPPAPYAIMHPEARLSDTDRQVLKSWSRTEYRRLATLRSKASPSAADGSSNGL